MRLRIETPQGTREFVARDGATYVVVGSRPSDDVHLADDPAVSAPHARLEHSLGKWTVADQFSSTGTIHNGRKTYNADLAAGDVIQIGSARITVTELDGVVAKEALAAPAPAIYTPAAVFPAAPAADPSEDLYRAMAEALRREGDDPEEDPEERERLRSAARAALQRAPHMRSAWISLLRDAKNVDDVIDHIAGELQTDIADLDDEAQRVAEYLVGEFRRENGIDLRGDALAMQRIADAAEAAVEPIRRGGWEHIRLPYIAANASGPIHLDTRVSVEVLNAPAPAASVPVMPMSAAPVRSPVPALLVGLVLFLMSAGAVVYVFVGDAGPDPVDFTEAPEMPRRDSAPERPKPAPEEPRRPDPVPPAPKGLTAARIQEIEKALHALAEKATEHNAVESLRSLEAFEAELAGEKQHGLRWPLERARNAVEQGIMVEMQHRYGRDNGDIYHLLEKSLYREAAERLAALDRHLNQTETHKKLARRMEMHKYLESQPPRILADNEQHIAKVLTAIDESLVRRQYAAAAEQLKALGTQAVLAEEIARDLKAEQAHWEEMAAKQEEGAVEPAIAPFDSRKNRPPAAPVNGLLPKGESTTTAAMRAIEKRLEQALKNGTLPGAVTLHHGREATVEKPDDWRVKLTVKRPFAGSDGSMSFVVRYAVHQLPPRARLGLLEGLEPSRDELLGLVLYAFANGLRDDAARIACALWKKDETVKSDLDALLAAKLGIAVPEGGFIERDGRLVPK